MKKKVRFEGLPDSWQAWLTRRDDGIYLAAGRGAGRAVAYQIFDPIDRKYVQHWEWIEGERERLVRGLSAIGALGIRKNIPKTALTVLGIEDASPT